MSGRFAKPLLLVFDLVMAETLGNEPVLRVGDPSFGQASASLGRVSQGYP